LIKFYTAAELNNYPNNLPQEPQNKVLFTLNQVVSINVNHIAANGLSRIESKCQILVLSINCAGFLVEGSLVNGVRARMIDHFPKTSCMVRTRAEIIKLQNHTYTMRMPSMIFW
jgi:hypothetical protein